MCWNTIGFPEYNFPQLFVICSHEFLYEVHEHDRNTEEQSGFEI
jgi:hypothetical protein